MNDGAVQNAPRHLISKGKIVFVVFAEIQGFGLGGDTLTGIVLELSAFFFFADYTTFGAKDEFLIDFGSVGAIGA